ncbi:response regulator [Vibrio sp. HDW18]|uniref:response regulator n=1 Tax=Vibrio sp. HDW18 TaxID=2714948 RepID=UPI0014083A4A|nr:response regulator [Vibrio sp. HDW18]QIL86588.1 response regulator [Vibrio sp. HDW18]
MINPSLSELRVLIIDDAQIVISNLRIMLLKFGFIDDKILTAKNPRMALFLAQKHKFDIILCDYNFGKGLNGKQLFEEFKHYNLLKNDSVFIIITGDSSSFVVHSILELRPDEYILKPFNILTLQERLISAILRKHTLKLLYEAESEGNYELGLALCDELEAFHVDYYFDIQKFKGEFLTNLRRYDHAREVYLDTLEYKDFDWAKIGLANALKQTGNHIEAMEIIQELLTNTPNNVRARVEAASISLSNNSIPEAIQHLKIASEIVPGHTEREWVLSNLCLSVGDPISALERYRLYVEINKETHLNNNQMHLNLIRCLLYSSRNSEQELRDVYLQESKLILKDLYDKGKHQELLPQLELVAAHIAMEENKYSMSIEILNKIYQEKQFDLFEDRYHFTWLLNIMSFDSEFSKSISWCNESLLVEGAGILLESKIALGISLKKSNEDKLKWLQERYKMLSNKNIGLDSLLDIYIQILDRCPTLRTICIKVVNILSRHWPNNLNETETENLLNRCNNTIRQLFSDQELNHMMYYELYEKAITFRVRKHYE